MAWYAEEAGYVYDMPQQSAVPFGHFTQMMWTATCEMGCGVADKYMVCRYRTAGNVVGQYIDNVCPKGGCNIIPQ